MKQSNKPPQNIVEEVFQGLEFAITKLIAWLGEEITKFIKKQINKSKQDHKGLDISFLNRKVKWFHPDAFAYSLKYKIDIGLDRAELNRHTIVCGTTGAGKNVLLDNIIENRLKAGLPVIMIDPKGDNQALEKFKKLNQYYNRKCYVFSENDPHSDHCNPILEGSAATIVNRLFAIFDWGEPYYADTNYIALETAVHGLKKDNHPVTIKSLYNYLDTNLKNKETQNIINKLSKIDRSAFGKILSAEKDAITFSKIRNDKASIYIGLSTLGFPETSQAIGKLFIYELMYHSYDVFKKIGTEKEKTNAPFTVVIDELGSVITEDFISLINKCRGAGIGICVSFQLLSDLDSISPQFRDRLIGNMNNFFIGHCHVEGEAEYWAKMIGTTQSKKFTYQTEDEKAQSMGSVRNVEEFLVHPNILKRLGIGQFIMKSFFPKNYLDLVSVHKKIDENFMRKIKQLKKDKQSKDSWSI